MVQSLIVIPFWRLPLYRDFATGGLEISATLTSVGARVTLVSERDILGGQDVLPATCRTWTIAWVGLGGRSESATAARVLEVISWILKRVSVVIVGSWHCSDSFLGGSGEIGLIVESGHATLSLLMAVDQVAYTVDEVQLVSVDR